MAVDFFVGHGVGDLAVVADYQGGGAHSEHLKTRNLKRYLAGCHSPSAN
jgi:hypothetical protein